MKRFLLLGLLFSSTLANALDWSAVTDENLIKIEDPHAVIPFQLTSETTLSAPYSVLSVQGRVIHLDMGNDLPTLKNQDQFQMTVVGTQGIVKLSPTKGRSEAVQYELPEGEDIGTPVVAFRGEFACDAVVVPTFKLDEVTPAGVLISEYRLFTVITGPTSADLYYGNSRILTSEPVIRPSSMEMMLELSSMGKKFYVVKMGLPQRDVVGLLFKFGKRWEFLYR